MPAILNEHTQWADASGAPIVGGKVYVGTQSADPVTNPITIYSDRALSVSITNPQVLDANGRTTNKIWVPGAYSIRVDTAADVQVYQELDNGAATDISTTALTSVAGSNTISATDPTGATAYVDKQQYIFTTVLPNTDDVTLNVNAIGAVAFLKNQDQQILPGELEADQITIAAYNAAIPAFEWTNQNVKTVAFTEGSDVASAATTNIWDTGGNSSHVTGTTTITSFGTAPAAGAMRRITFDDAVLLTQSANLNLPGGVNYTTAAGDIAWVYADTTTQFDVTIAKADGTAVVTVREYIQIEDQKSDGTNGGTPVVTTWTARTLNTEVLDTGGNASLSSDAVTLDAGTYELEAISPFYATGGTRLRWQNTSDATTVGLSLSGEVGATNTFQGQIFMHLKARFVIATSKTFELQYFLGTATATVGLGADDAQTLGVEIYSQVILRKVA